MKTPLEKWWWIDFVKYADTSSVNEAKKSAGGSDQGDLSKSLPFTEENYKFNLLYNHIRVGQIEPKKMKRLQRKYLDYIAGMEYPHPDLLKGDLDQLMKLQGNVSRAKYELTKRNLFWATAVTGVAAFGGAVLAVVVKG